MPDDLPNRGGDRLHVVFGTGEVGRALAARLAGLGMTVRAVSRHRPPGLADEIDWRAADVTDRGAASDAAKNAALVSQCLNAPYSWWPELFPPLQESVLPAAKRTGALLVTLENPRRHPRPAAARPRHHRGCSARPTVGPEASARRLCAVRHPRGLGYGLKYGDHFQHTHLGHFGRPRPLTTPISARYLRASARRLI